MKIMDTRAHEMVDPMNVTDNLLETQREVAGNRVMIGLHNLKHPNFSEIKSEMRGRNVSFADGNLDFKP